MATFNVFYFRDPNTGLRACYCYDLNLVGTGNSRRAALNDLSDLISSFGATEQGTVDRGPVLREDIRLLASGLVFDKRKPTQVLNISSGHTLHIYRVPFYLIHDYVKDEEERHRREIESEIQRSEAEWGRSVDGDFPKGEEDIPF